MVSVLPLIRDGQPTHLEWVSLQGLLFGWPGSSGDHPLLARLASYTGLHHYVVLLVGISLSAVSSFTKLF